MIEFFQYSLAAVVSYLGLAFGGYLIQFAPEEQKPGKPYFVLLKKLLFAVMVASLLFFYKVNVLITIAVLLFLLILLLTKKLELTKNKVVYFILGIFFYFSTHLESLFILESILIFVYGLPTAALLFDVKKKNYKEILIGTVLFFIPVFLLPFVSLAV